VVFRFRYLDAPPREAVASAMQALRAVGLEGAADRQARLLSGGEKQRTAIARAVVRRPRLLLADEPTGNLVPAAGEAVMETLAAIHREGIAVVLVSHNERWLPYATRHLVCHDGRIRGEAG
jgi:ABC-type ATPase involved in cell division